MRGRAAIPVANLEILDGRTPWAQRCRSSGPAAEPDLVSSITRAVQDPGLLAGPLPGDVRIDGGPAARFGQVERGPAVAGLQHGPERAGRDVAHCGGEGFVDVVQALRRQPGAVRELIRDAFLDGGLAGAFGLDLQEADARCPHRSGCGSCSGGGGRGRPAGSCPAARCRSRRSRRRSSGSRPSPGPGPRPSNVARSCLASVSGTTYLRSTRVCSAASAFSSSRPTGGSRRGLLTTPALGALMPHLPRHGRCRRAVDGDGRRGSCLRGQRLAEAAGSVTAR